jgi:hypothetical protein
MSCPEVNIELGRKKILLELRGESETVFKRKAGNGLLKKEEEPNHV